jgi:peptidoglycan/LPS O-acetylase OafA/YrhL
MSGASCFLCFCKKINLDFLNKNEKYKLCTWPKTSFFCVLPFDYRMYLNCKLLFAAVYAVMSSAPPYLSLFYAKIMHFSSDQIGVLLAIAPFVQSIACPFWTHVVDKKPQWHAPLMGILCIIGGTAVLSVMYLGKQTEEKSRWTLEISLPWLTSACVFCYAFCSGTLVSLVDSAVMKILGSNKIMYGM